LGWQEAAVELLARLAQPAQPRPLPHIDVAVRRRLIDAKIDGLERLCADAPTPLHRVYERVWLAQLAAAREVVAELARRGAEPILFKGVELCARHLSTCIPSMMGDVDMLVPRQQLGTVRAALFALGYRQADYDVAKAVLIDADIANIAAVESAHYEMFPFRRAEPLALDVDELAAMRALPTRAPLYAAGKTDQCQLVMEVDVHHRVALDIETAPLLERCQDSALAGARTFGNADHLWIATARYYCEVAVHGKRTLRDFVYLVSLLRDNRVDWDVVLDAAREYELRPALFYYLTFADRLFESGIIPAPTLAELDPRRGSRLRDWGWQLGALFDAIEPMPSYGRP
jgi:hypothetical protein